MEQNKTKKTPLVVAFITDHPRARALLHVARRRAADMEGTWRAVFIETPHQHEQVEEGKMQHIQQLLTLARQMGGEGVYTHSETLEAGVLKILKEEMKRLCLIIRGEARSGNRIPKFQLSAWDRITRTAREQQVNVEHVPLSDGGYRQTFRERLRIRPAHIVYALLAVGSAMLCASLLEALLPPALFRINNQNVGLLFMIACAFAAGRFGLLPGLVASGASFLIVNYYFTVPYHSLKFNNITDTLNLLLFLSASLFISLFASQTRGYAEKAARRELNTQALFTLYRLATNASSRGQAIEELQQKLTHMLMMDVAFFLPSSPEVKNVSPATPGAFDMSKADNNALDLCWKEMKTTGFASAFYPEAGWRFEPMNAPGGEIGVLGVRPARTGQIDTWFGGLLTAIADQTAAVLEHIELERTMEAARIREEREKLRSMLLSSVSHDLKTPLASIIGALNIFRSQGKRLSVEKQEVLIETALQESERLDSFITNILDMTHLESGKIEFRQDWGDVHSIVQHVIKRLEYRLRQHRVHLHPVSSKIDVFMDAMMIEQVMQNVLDNASKYTPSGTLIEVICSPSEANGFRCEVHDHGPGLPPEKLERVFDKYARLHKKDSQIAGTGLGLAICKAMMEAQGGSIIASNHKEGGAVFTLTLPRWRDASTTKYVA